MKSPLKILLFLLIILTFVNIFQKISGLSAQSPKWPPPAHLRLPGYQVIVVFDRAGSIGRDFSTGNTRLFRFTSMAHGPAFELTTMAVNSIYPDILQLNRIIVDQPHFVFTVPRLISHSSSTYFQGHKDQLALSTSHGRTRLQTCLMRSGKAGYSQATLGDEWVRDDLTQFDGQPGRKYRDHLSRFLALQPTLLSECLVVQLETARSPTAQKSLLKAWGELKSQLLPELGA
jgi:hypothetical protein